MAPSMAEWLPGDHLAWFVIDAVDQIDTEAFTRAYRADGRGGAAHDPVMMVALLVYAYCTGVVSSRRIEAACVVDVAFRVIAGNQVPDHTTIARFRARHEQALGGLFTDVLRLCARAGMVNLGSVALDGTKMRAPAALAANRSKDTITTQVEELLAAAGAADAAEDAAHGTGSRGDEPPAQLRARRDRISRFAAAKEQLEAAEKAARAEHEEHLRRRSEIEAQRGTKLRGRKPKAPGEKATDKTKGGQVKTPRANTTDPDSRIMATRQGFVQGYNAQAAATSGGQVIIAAEVTDETGDTHQLLAMLEATRASLVAAGIEENVGDLLADAGYASEANFASLGAQHPDCYVATRNMRKNPEPRNGTRGPLRAGASLVEKMDRKVSRKDGAARYRKRQGTIEPVFGQIKTGRHITGFTRRGKPAASAEWKLICATHNLLKLYRNQPPSPAPA